LFLRTSNFDGFITREHPVAILPVIYDRVALFDVDDHHVLIVRVIKVSLLALHVHIHVAPAGALHLNGSLREAAAVIMAAPANSTVHVQIIVMI
jgi:hypothetical protein